MQAEGSTEVVSETAWKIPQQNGEYYYRTVDSDQVSVLPQSWRVPPEGMYQTLKTNFMMMYLII